MIKFNILFVILISFILLYTVGKVQYNINLKQEIKKSETQNKLFNRLYYDSGKNTGLLLGYGKALVCVKNNGYEFCKDKFLKIAKEHINEEIN